jgi:hypothetical protein
VAEADLGGLGGPVQGSTLYTWSRLSPMPYTLPWLGLLLLLMLPANRMSQAWWIWAPVIAIEVCLSILPALWPETPADAWATFGSPANALAYGLAAVWLALPSLTGIQRPLDALALVAVLVGSTLVTCLARNSGLGFSAELLGVTAICGVVGVMAGVALSVACWFCRRSFATGRFGAWILACLALGWAALISIPFALAGANGPSLSEALAGLAIATLASFGLVAPFVTLSSVNGFYAARLRAFAAGDSGAAAGQPPTLPPLAPTPAQTPPG